MQQINTKKKNKKYLVIYKIVNKMISACDALGKDFPCFLLFFFKLINFFCNWIRGTASVLEYWLKMKRKY